MNRQVKQCCQLETSGGGLSAYSAALAPGVVMAVLKATAEHKSAQWYEIPICADGERPRRGREWNGKASSAANLKTGNGGLPGYSAALAPGGCDGGAGSHRRA